MLNIPNPDNVFSADNLAQMAINAKKLIEKGVSEDIAVGRVTRDFIERKTAPLEHLTCACCGSGTRGRQWWNRDEGFGLCVNCIDFCASEDFRLNYGDRGINFDVADQG